MSESTNNRPETTPVEIENREIEWWQEFAELEERFAWVQTPSIQRILRGRYVREIVKFAGADGRILELGCGVGWLCSILAESGAKEVVGVDFSPAQIAIAKARAEALGLTGRVNFICADGTQEKLVKNLYNCVVVHGFLHHLNREEIQRTLASIPKLLKSNGTFIAFEPFRHEAKQNKVPPVQIKWQDNLAQWANRGQRLGLRTLTNEEKKWRDLFAHRNWGTLPHGPSPKEIPFAPGELEGYLNPHFIIESQDVCMVRSHLIVQEWLLREVSNPRMTRWLLPWVARAAAWLDRGMFQKTDSLPNSWIFKMLVCRPRVSRE